MTSSITMVAADRLLVQEFRKGNAVTFRVGSGSMMPCLAPGDQVTVRPITDDRVNVGEIVLIDAGDDLILHRVVHRKSDGIYLTAGESARCCDSPVKREEIVGRAVSVTKGDVIVRLSCGMRAVFAAWRLRVRVFSYTMFSNIRTIVRHLIRH